MKKKQKPEATPFFQFYFVDPIRDLGYEFTDCIQSLWIWLNDMWYCDHCKKFHGRRVHKHVHHDVICDTHIDKYICSLGVENLKQQAKQLDINAQHFDYYIKEPGRTTKLDECRRP